MTTSSPRRPSTLALLTALAAGLTAGLAGCSGSDEPKAAAPSSTRPSVSFAGMPAPQWAATVCGGITTWRKAADDNLAKPVASGPVPQVDADLQTRLKAVSKASHDLAVLAAETGAPAVASGESAHLQLAPLSAQLDGAANVIDTLLGGPVTDVADAKTRLEQARTVAATAKHATATALTSISQLEPAGRLGQALAADAGCKALLAAKG